MLSFLNNLRHYYLSLSPYEIVLSLFIFYFSGIASTVIHELGHATAYLFYINKPSIIVFDIHSSKKDFHEYPLIKLGRLHLYVSTYIFSLTGYTVDNPAIKKLAPYKFSICAVMGPLFNFIALCILTVIFTTYRSYPLYLKHCTYLPCIIFLINFLPFNPKNKFPSDGYCFLFPSKVLKKYI